MKKYTNADPSFKAEIDIYEATDPADADSVDNVPLKQLQDNALALKKLIDEGGGGGTGSLATEQEVKDMAEHIMEEGGGGVLPETATDEDIEELIEDLDDL